MKKLLLLLISTFLLVYAILPHASATVGFGVSDYDATVTVYYQETRKVECARIYNTGNETLNVTISWTSSSPSANAIGPTVTWMILLPDESKPVTLTVTGLEMGFCNGRIDFVCSASREGQGGNPNVAGGTAHLRLSIEIKPVQNTTSPSGFTMPFPIEYLLIPLLAIPSSIGTVLYVKRRKHPSISTPKLAKQKGQPNDKHVRKELMKLSKILQETRDSETSDDTLAT